jgi:hypothetical protein
MAEYKDVSIEIVSTAASSHDMGFDADDQAEPVTT